MKVILTKEEKSILEELAKTGKKHCIREDDKDNVCEDCKYNVFDCFNICTKCSKEVLKSMANNILVVSEEEKNITKEDFIDFIDDEELTDETIFIENIDSAIIGYTYNDKGTIIVIYSRNKIITKIMELYNMTQIDADNWVQFNIEPICIGENAPIIMENL